MLLNPPSTSTLTIHANTHRKHGERDRVGRRNQQTFGELALQCSRSRAHRLRPCLHEAVRAVSVHKAEANKKSNARITSNKTKNRWPVALQIDNHRRLSSAHLYSSIFSSSVSSDTHIEVGCVEIQRVDVCKLLIVISPTFASLPMSVKSVLLMFSK